MKLLSGLLFLLLFLLIVAGQSAQADKDDIVIANNSDIGATLTAQGQKQQVKGTISLHFAATQRELSGGAIRVEDLNVLLRGVQQSLLSNKASRVSPFGTVGIVLNKSIVQTLKYDERTLTLSGELSAFSEFSQMLELVPSNPLREKEQDNYSVPMQKTKISINLKLPAPIKIAPDDTRTHRIEGQASIHLSVADLPTLKFNRYEILLNAKLPIDYGIVWNYEIGSRLCLQPVFIRSGPDDASPTGAGLAFGMPGANTQWSKGRVSFNVRAPKYINNGALKIANEGDEEVAIRNSVNDDDCIEVFFINNFNPVSLHGGGATWGSGSSSAKVISSDGNASFGVDLTHLAHELGHVLALAHPGSGCPNADRPNMFDASSGTLMCPSGWHNDNPKINSAENREKRTNPLLKFSLVRKGGGPDCANDADCGACP